MIFAQWHGGANYAHGGVEDREAFPTWTALVDAMKDRRDVGHYWEQPFAFVNRAPSRALTPCVDNDSYMDIYATESSDDIVSRVEFGPRGGIRRWVTA